MEIEQFDGQVDYLDSEFAYFTLFSNEKETLLGKFTLEQLKKFNLKECQNFICSVIAQNNEHRIDIIPLPHLKLSLETIQSIDLEINSLLPWCFEEEI